jgi:hypothetical protein
MGSEKETTIAFNQSIFMFGCHGDKARKSQQLERANNDFVPAAGLTAVPKYTRPPL